MVAVIFETDSIVIGHACKMNVPGEPPEVVAAVIFRKNGLNPLDYTVRQLASNCNLRECRENYYIENNQVYRKSYFELVVDIREIVADGVDKATISNCPEGSTISADGILLGTVGSDGLVEVTSIVPKVMKVVIEKEHYVLERMFINAT